MAKSVTTADCSDSESSEATPTTEEDHRKKAYKWYKHNAKPTKNNMCLIIDALNDTGISRQDIDLMPWNPEETKVIKEDMKSPIKKKADKEEKTDKADKADKKDKKKEKKDKKDKKDKKKKDKKATEREEKLPKGQEGNSLTSPDNSQNGSSRSLDAGSDSGGQDFTRYDNENGEFDIGSRVYADQVEQLQTFKVEEEHKRKKEKRRREKDEAKKKSEEAKKKSEEAKKKSEEAKKKSKAEADKQDKKKKDKEAMERSSREEKDFTRHESKNGEYEVAHGLYAEQTRAYSVEEELTRKREELMRKKEERRRAREEAKKKSMPEETAEEMTKARRDERIELAFKWYTRMAMPSREEFKGQIETQRVEITSEDVDLLSWNATGSRVTNISAMNNMIRTRMMKEATAKKAPAPRRVRPGLQ
jgi:hypothetical protein